MASNRPGLYRSGFGYPFQLPPKIWAQKELNISKKMAKIFNNMPKSIKNQKTLSQNPLFV
jgi:hypothetical protein